MATMRRKDRMITESDSLAIINKEKYGVLSTIDTSGNPYGLPLNYCFINDALYFHCAMEGLKLESIRKNPSVSFSIVGKTQILPDKFSTVYESVIITGSAVEVEAVEKQLALEGLLKKYSPDYISNGMNYINHLEDKTVVIKIDINTISGKARRL